jgi:Fe-S oxidoreductase/nitrate reductase gamma subunit
MRMEQASRPIMWNVEALPNTIVMYLLLAVVVAICGTGILRRAELWLSGNGIHVSGQNFWQRTKGLFVDAFLQKATINHGHPSKRGLVAGHTLVYIGFLALLFTTTMVLVDHDLGIPIYQGRFYLAVTLMSDLLGLGVILGALYLSYRRYMNKPDGLHSTTGDSYALIMIAIVCIQGFLLEALRIHVTEDPWAIYSPIGMAISQVFWPISDSAARGFHFVLWWTHTCTVFAALALIPYSKFFHIVASSANLFFRNSKTPRGKLASPGDIEALMEQGDEFVLGTEKIGDYSWKKILDLDACTSCGRCQEVCPAYLSGKPLSPKWLILDTRNHALGLASQGKFSSESLLPSALVNIDQHLMAHYITSTSGLRADSGTQETSSGYVPTGTMIRGMNPLVQNPKVFNIAQDAEHRIAGQVMSQDVFWACNTCLACVEACPVGINHVEHIVENRRNMALMHGEIPSEAAPTLRAIETRGNPYGAAEDRVKWAEGLDVPILGPGDSVNVLYWVGCVSAYDPRKQKIARSMVKVLNASGLSWGILGNAEGCTGDPARRIGEENLFQTMAKSNLEILRGLRFETLVANCPHCFNTIKNEYPEFGNLGEGRTPRIIHHSAFLRELLDAGSVTLAAGAEESVTFHDPCYLGRGNNEYEAPRDTLKKNSSLKILEMEASRNKGLCCGAGGGHFWYDMKIGERVNVMRVDQAAATGASKIASACPFCMQMLEDGIKLTDREEQMSVRDIAEFVAENMMAAAGER